jgi:hypothetical protein
MLCCDGFACDNDAAMGFLVLSVLWFGCAEASSSQEDQGACVQEVKPSE